VSKIPFRGGAAKGGEVAVDGSFKFIDMKGEPNGMLRLF
jgi:hypothetical protein